jgi:hypothetical protein
MQLVSCGRHYPTFVKDSLQLFLVEPIFTGEDLEKAEPHSFLMAQINE